MNEIYVTRNLNKIMDQSTFLSLELNNLYGNIESIKEYVYDISTENTNLTDIFTFQRSSYLLKFNSNHG